MNNSDLQVCPEDLIEKVLSAATVVHQHLGPGLLESVYESALMLELSAWGISAMNQVEVPAFYRESNLGVGFRADIIVENCLLLELKSVSTFTPLHLAQAITYLRLLKFKRGFLINFNNKLLKDGIRRVSI